MIKAAGILILDKNNNALFLKRGPGSDYPGLWAFPGGRLEDDESPMHAAIRETSEEAGFEFEPGLLRSWTRTIRPSLGEAGEDVDFTTYLLRGAEQFIPVLGPAGSPEHVAYAWAPISEPPEPMHPGAAVALRRFSMHETDVANAMAAGELTSPQTVDNMTLFAIRITGTGTSYRTAFNEHVWRDPSLYLTTEFVQRCNGLPVILEHPKGSILNSKEFSNRIVGTIVLPYIKGDEVWGIARIYDAAVIEMMTNDQMSTSPAVVWRDPDVNQKFTQDDGSTFLIEGKPSLLDHIAICERGVWDKGGGPTGVESVTVKTDEQPLARGDSQMAGLKLTRLKDESDDAYKARCDEMQKLIDGAKADAEGDSVSTKKALDAVTAALDAANARMDAIEEEKKADKAKADAAEEEEKEEKKADARRRADAFKFSKRKDGEDEDEFKERRDAEEKACADAEMEAGEPEPMAVDKAKKRRDAADSDDEEDEKKKADSARPDSETIERMIAEGVAAGLKRVSRTDDELNDFYASQGRADEVYSAFSKSAPRPLDGESLLGYRRRLLTPLKEHTTHKNTDLGVVSADSATFAVIENQIYTEAAAVARSPASVPPGELREVTRTKNGHTYTDFIGDPAVWLSGHSPVAQAVTGFGSTAK